MTGRVLCVGRLYADLVFTGVPRLPSLGTEVFADGVSLHAGGGAFITAACLAALGRPTALAAVLPAAPFAAPVLEEIDDCFVDRSWTQPAEEGHGPQITAAMACARDRAFLTHRIGRAAPLVTAQALAAAQIVHVHIGELTTLVEQPGLVAAARAAGASLSLDCGWDDALTPADARLASAVDVFLPNQSELERLMSWGTEMPSLTVVKLGDGGAETRTEHERLWAPAVSGITPVDTTGAGDAFNGGFLDAWLGGATLTGCLAMGNRCGAAAVTAAGGTAGLQDLRRVVADVEQPVAGA